MTVLYFKFIQNCQADEEFDFFEGMGGGEGAPNFKLYSSLLLVNISKCYVS